MTNPTEVHVCILCTQHSPDDSRVTHKLGAMFVKSGFRVTWIGPECGVKGNVPGIIFYYYTGAGRSRLTRRLGQSRRLERTCLGLPEIATVDVFIGAEPDSAAVGGRLARRFHARSVFDIHEIYHKDMLAHWVPRWIRPVAAFAVFLKLRSVCRHVDLVIGPALTRVAPYEAIPGRSMIVRHCLSKEVIERHEARPLDDTRNVIRIMHGKATLILGTLELVRGVALAEKRLNRGETLRIVCFDDDFGVKGAQGRSEFLEMLRNERAEHLVEMNPRVPFSSMLPLLSACDIGVIAYGRKLGVTCQPNRIFEYMAVGLPVIVPDYAVELRPIIEKYHCGLAVDMERPEAIAEAVVQLVTNRAAARKMGRAGREGSLAELNMEREIRPLIEWIRQPREQAGHENKAGR